MSFGHAVLFGCFRLCIEILTIDQRNKIAIPFSWHLFMWPICLVTFSSIAFFKIVGVGKLKGGERAKLCVCVWSRVSWLVLKLLYYIQCAGDLRLGGVHVWCVYLMYVYIAYVCKCLHHSPLQPVIEHAVRIGVGGVIAQL